jgi:hypothetical protein
MYARTRRLMWTKTSELPGTTFFIVSDEQNSPLQNFCAVVCQTLCCEVNITPAH